MYRNVFVGFTVNIDHVVEIWELADMYQLEGLKHYCKQSIGMGLCDENVLLSRVLQEAEESNCPCDELKMMRCKEKE